MGRKSREWKEEVLSYFSIAEWKEFVKLNFKAFDRYTRDQCREARKYFKGNEIEETSLRDALRYCLENETYSMKNLIDSYKYFKCNKERKFNRKVVSKGNFPETSLNIVEVNHIEVMKPDVKIYEGMINGGSL